MLFARFLTRVFSFSILLLLLITSCSNGSSTVKNQYAGAIRNISSMDLVAEMGIGWNLGNSYDVGDRDKTKWGNPLPNKQQIDAVKEMGFETVRIPITWNYNMQHTPPFKVDPDYLAAIKTTVNNVLANHMHAIINVHHDNLWIKPTDKDAKNVKIRLSALWTQIAKEFIEYGDSLIFETLNEPRLEDSPEEWSGGTLESRSVLNDFHKVSVDAIRATGGNNEHRHLMISTYAASTNEIAMNDLIIPNDDSRIIISLHSYFPWSFAALEDGSSTWGTDKEIEALNSELERIKQKWIVQENRAVIMGEWGAINRDNLHERINYAEHYVKACKEKGLLPIVWDDGGNFQLLDRRKNVWVFPDIVEAIIRSAK